MPIDASIPLRAGSRDWSLADLMKQQQDGEYRQAQIDDLQHKRTQQATLSSLLPKAMTGDEQALQGVAGADPDTYMRVQTYRQASDKAATEQRSTQVQQLGRLLDHAVDEPTYQESIAAARQMGLDVGTAPPNFDPAWKQKQLLIRSAYQKDPEGLTSNMKELVALGYKVGTPEFEDALAKSINAGYAKPYTGSGGETRLYTPNIAVPQQQAPQAPQPQQHAGQPSPRIIAQRPAGKSNDQLMSEAYEAVNSGQASYDEVFQQLKAWGVNP